MSENEPYVFLTQGDIGWVQADVVVIPTSFRRGGSGMVYRAVCRRLPEEERAAFERAYEGLATQVLLRPKAEDAVGRARVAVIVETLAGAKANQESVRAAVSAAFGLLPNPLPETKRLRVAMPAFGTGKGSGENALSLATAQLKGLRQELKKRPDIDVVLVLNDPAAYARFVQARTSAYEQTSRRDEHHEIASLVKKERVILFVGAGVSRGAGLPDWHELMERFVQADEELRVELLARWKDEPFGQALESALAKSSGELPRKKAAEGDKAAEEGLEAEHYAKIAQRFTERWGQRGRQRIIDECLSAEAMRNRPPTVAQYMMLQMPFRYVVTTNFDTFVERTLHDLKRVRSVVVGDADVSASGDPGQVSVFKIHGTASGDGHPASDIVLTTKEFRKFGKRNPAKKALLEALLLNHHFLFVGYSHSDTNLNSIRSAVGKNLAGTQRKAWATEIQTTSSDGDVSWLSFADPRRLDIWLDKLAAATADTESTFLANRTWQGSPALGPLHAALGRLPGEELDKAWSARETWTADDVRVLTRVITTLTDLGWRKSGDTNARPKWWKALAQAAKRLDQKELAESLQRRVLAEPEEEQNMTQSTQMSLEEAALDHDVFVKSDSIFQRRARLLQALWREREGLPVGLHREAPLGSRLAMPRAEEQLENYLTPAIREVVKREVLDKTRSSGKFFARPRIFNDLLSSQPLCFNLFGELAEDLELATRVFRRLVRTGVGEVTGIDFEWSPGRGDERFTGDKSAFDVFVRYNDDDGKPCFIGIEVKYHENLQDQAARLRPRYEEVAQAMGVFDEDRLGELRTKPLQQVWRDHLLAGSMLSTGDWSRGEFVFLYPRDNDRCETVVTRYAECLSDDTTFAAWTLEGVVNAIRAETEDVWVSTFHSRYLAFDCVDGVLAGTLNVESPAHVKREERLANLLRWAKEIPGPLRMLHDKYGPDVHLRPTSKGVTLLGLTPERPQRGKSGFRNLSRIVDNFEQLFAEHCQPEDHGRPTPEKALQSALIRNAYMQQRVMKLLGDATKSTNDEVAPIFVADELALPTDSGRVVCDIFAVRALGKGVFRPMVIELKSKREMTRLIEQVGVYASLVEEHASAFSALAKVLLERDVRLEGKCERWIVWPDGRPGQPDRREAELAEHGIRVVTYEVAGDGFVFRAGEAP